MASITSKLHDARLSARQSIQEAKAATTATLAAQRVSLEGRRSGRRNDGEEDDDPTVASTETTTAQHTRKQVAVERINGRWKTFSASLKANMEDSMEEVKTDMTVLKQDSTRLFRLASERASASMRGMGDSMTKVIGGGGNSSGNGSSSNSGTESINFMPHHPKGTGETVQNLQHAALLYRKQMQSLRDRGFLVPEENTEHYCLELLQQNDGNLDRTVAMLGGTQ